MTELVVAIFPHGAEIGTPDKLRDYLYKLRKIEGRYLCGKLKKIDTDFKERLLPCSLVLFSKKGLIVGKATTKTMFHKFETPVKAETEDGKEAEYYHEIFFVPESIKICQQRVSVDTVEKWADKKHNLTHYRILGTRLDFEKAFPDC